MTFLIGPIIGRSIPALAAVALGAAFLTSAPALEAVEDGSCATFLGTSSGNDPSQAVVLGLCRDGTRLEAIKSSDGEAGRTVFALRGEVLSRDTMTLVVSDVLEDRPAAGWLTCADDVFTLRWDEAQGALIGGYVSAECDDRAQMRLVRLDETPCAH